ncbi:MAG: hypothetical protein ACE5OO_08395 [Candidatus Bathyarchaeia archaeon]
MSFAAGLVHADSKPVVVAHLKGALEADAQLNALMGNMTEIEWVLVTGDLSSAELDGAAMLIMVKADSAIDYTADELTAIKNWFDSGGKTIWVAADSDYGTDQLRQPTANVVLEEIGSVLRIEACSAEDPVSSAGRPYRVLGVSEKCDEEVDFLVAGVTRALFHGPAIITAYADGKYYKLEEEAPEGVYKVMTTTENGVVVNNNPPDPEVHEVGDEGTFVLMAMELDYEKKNVVIATGDAPFDQYTGMYKPEIRRYERYMVEYPQQGARLFENIINYVINYADKMMDLRNQVAAQKGQVAALQGQVSTLQEQVKTLQNQVSTLNDQVSSLEGEVTTLEGDKATLESEKATLEGKVSTLEGEVKSLKGSVGTWQGISAGTFVVGLLIGVAVIYMMKR